MFAPLIRRVLTGLVALTASALLTTGCARVDPQQLGQAAPPSSTAASASTDAPIPGVETTQISRDDPTLPIHVVWPVVAGMPALNTLVSDAAHHLARAFERDHSPSSEQPPELQGTGTVTLDAAGVVGVRMQIYEVADGATTNRVRMFYGRRTPAAAWTGTDLIAASARTSVVPVVVSAASAQGHDPLATASSNAHQEAVLSGLSFDSAGGLVATPDQGSILPNAEGLVPITLDPIASEPLLSADGLVVQQAARQGASAAPESSASSTYPAANSSTASSTTPALANPSLMPATATTSPANPSSAPNLAPASTRPQVNCAKKKCVALTFDDGPGPYTETLLNELDKAGVKATFFQVGLSAKQYPQVIARQVKDGMVIGNHTYDHRNLAAMPRTAQAAEVRRADHWITAGGASTPTLLRPPYGSYDHDTRSLGKSIILWNVDSEDWKNRNSAKTTALIMKEVQPGSIVLMHDIHPTTVAAVPGIIQKLRAKGYTLVTVPELLGTTTPGTVYFGR